ncbi:MAG: DUF308 domain-containing protein [Acidimicrobiia bacterium]
MSDSSTGAPPGPEFGASWILVLIVGLITLGLGIAVLVWPDRTVEIVVILTGIFLFLWGVFRFVTPSPSVISLSEVWHSWEEFSACWSAWS